MLTTMLKTLTVGLTMTALTASMAADISAQSPAPVADSDRAAIEDIVRRYYEIAGSGDLTALEEILAPDFAIRNAPPGEDAGMAGLVFSLERARTSRPDFTFRIEDLIVDGNAVVVRTTIAGTHLGDFFGLAPTGKRVEIPAIDLWHVENGKLAAVWHEEDILGMMEQLGMVPGGATATAMAATPQPTAAASSATTDAAHVAANVALARRFRGEMFGQGHLDSADAILAPGFIWHSDVPPGVEGAKTVATTMRTAFPDLTLTADDVVAEGDRVAILWTLRGTHRGEFLGAAATGQSIETTGIDIDRIADGRIAEMWTVGDDLGLLFQLGAFPEFES